jgi:hypothetical protein
MRKAGRIEPPKYSVFVVQLRWCLTSRTSRSGTRHIEALSLALLPLAMAEPQPTPSIFQTQKVKLSSKNFTSLAIDPTGRWAALSGYASVPNP